MTKHVIEISNLKFKQNKFVLDIPSLHIPKGYITGLIGENGAGKTTLIYQLLNLTTPDSGEIKIFDQTYYAINDDFCKFHGIMLMFGISLIMNGLMLIFGIKNSLSYVILASIGGAFLIFAFGFHYLLVMNDFNMHLNLSDNKYWHFYLYQMPYIVTAIGIIICITSLFIVRKC